MTEAPCLLLTGGNGFVGRYLAPRLVEMYPTCRRIMLTKDEPTEPIAGWETSVMDLASEADVDAIIAQARPSVVVHLAAQSSVGAGLAAAQATWRGNVLGTLALAGAIERHAPTGVFMFTSTSEVYGASFLSGPADEDTATAPMNSYAVSKLAAEHILRDVLPPTCQLLIMRAFNHSGPGQDERFVLASFAAQIARAEAGVASAILRVGNLAAERDFLNVVDVVDAYARVLERKDALPSRIILNVASGRGRRLADLLDMLCQMSARPVEIEVDPDRMRKSDIPSSVGDASRLRQLTGWQPRTGIEETMRDLLEFYRQITKAV